MTELTIHADGAARGNPGPAGAGAVLTDMQGKIVKEVCRYLGETTNNQAEYQALIIGLKEAKDLGALRVSIFADSELMVRQIKGEYKVKNGGLKPLFQEVMGMLRHFGGYHIEHIPREKNKRADQLANLAIDGQML
jgi:ribonuclease HI